MSTVIDLTSGLDLEMKKLIEEVEDQQDFSGVLMNHSFDAIVTYDSELRYVIFNPAAERLTGLKKEQVVGRTPFELFPVIQGTPLGEALLNALKGTTTRLAWPFNGPEGEEKVIAGIHSPLVNEFGKITGVISIVRDTKKELEFTEPKPKIG
jgi:PAS domain S-box-containing protein